MTKLTTFFFTKQKISYKDGEPILLSQQGLVDNSNYEREWMQKKQDRRRSFQRKWNSNTRACSQASVLSTRKREACPTDNRPRQHPQRSKPKEAVRKLRPFSLMFTRQHLRRNLRNGCSRFLDTQSRIGFRWV